MVLFAVNVMEKLRNLPRKDLANLGLAVLILIVAIIIIKQAARLNRFVLFMIILVTIMVVGFTWVYQRNEPKFLTPLVDGIAPFFPHRP
jgi:uncharacterized membrane protein YqjE